MRGADLLMRTLESHGVRTVFTLSGNQIMPAFDAAVDTDIRLVHVRHEAAAVQMAEAYAQVTGGIGVALVTAGPGFANALGALYGARASETPVLLLAGDAPLTESGRGAFQELDQCTAARPMAKLSRRARNADDLGTDAADLIAAAQAGRPGPVHLALPFDVVTAAVADGTRPAAPQARSPAGIDGAAARAIAAALREAERPLVLAGPCLCRHWHKPALAALEEALAAPVIALESPRGLSDPSLGALGDAMPRADAILLLGKALDFAIGFGDANAESRFLQIDPEETVIARSRAALGPRLMGAHLADAADSIAPLADAAIEAPAPARRAWRAEVSEAIAYRPAEWADLTSGNGQALHPLEVFRAVQDRLDAEPQAILVSDGGEFGQWALACLKAQRWIKNGPSGAIGACVPYAIAAQLADPAATVLAVSGDGAVGFHIAEFDTALRHDAPIVVVVGTDARWNAEYQIQLRDYGENRAIACDLRDSAYEMAARAFGGHGAAAATPEDLAAALKDAQASGKPALVNTRLDGQPAPRLTRASAVDSH